MLPPSLIKESIQFIFCKGYVTKLGINRCDSDWHKRSKISIHTLWQLKAQFITPIQDKYSSTVKTKRTWSSDVLIQTVIPGPTCTASLVNINQTKSGHNGNFQDLLTVWQLVFCFFFLSLWLCYFLFNLYRVVQSWFSIWCCFDHIPETVMGQNGIIWSYSILQRNQHAPFLFKSSSCFKLKVLSHAYSYV